MNNQQRIQRAIQKLKQETSNAAYFIENIVTQAKDKKSAQNHINIKQTILNIENIIRQELDGLEKELEVKATADRDAIFKKRLGTVNSPTATMKKTAEQFLERSKTPNVLIRHAMAEQIRRASLKNATKKSGAN